MNKQVLVLLASCTLALGALAACATPVATGSGPATTEASDVTAAKKTTPAPDQPVGADNPLIQYDGRVDFSDPKAPSFAFPGVAISARFEGTALDIVLADTGKDDYFNVVIDGQAPQVIQTAKGTKTFQVARNLAEGVHTVRLSKRTEALCGTATFKGFMLEAGRKLVEADPLPVRKLEFIGDSITCGYGNMVSTTSPDKFHFTAKNENNDLSWGALTAKALGARFMCTAWSGKGMFRNLDSSETATIPQLYRSIFPGQPEKATWDAKNYTPDVIVINLGTNDFGSLASKADLDEETFDARYAETYGAFIKTLRELHGSQVKIICAVGPMMSDYYPVGMRCWTRIQDAVGTLVDTLNEQGDQAVHFLALSPQQSPYGEDWHPSAQTHEAMSETAVDLIREVTGW